MGVSYMGGARYYHRITGNIPVLSNTFNYNNGYFGKKGTSNKVRIISSDDPLKTAIDFYDKLCYGGLKEELPSGKGWKVSMADGSIITFRPKSSSDGSPAIDINLKDSNYKGKLKSQKIHFTEGE